MPRPLTASQQTDLAKEFRQEMRAKGSILIWMPFILSILQLFFEWLNKRNMRITSEDS